MSGQRGFWDIEHRLAELSSEGDPLERLSATVDFEIFRRPLERAVRRRDPAQGGHAGSKQGGNQAADLDPGACPRGQGHNGAKLSPKRSRWGNLLRP